MRKILIASSVIALLALSGCGSDSSPTPPSGGNNPPVVPPVVPPDNSPVEGIATPSSVAVVTATNAQ
jgi:hypothetical protein